VLTRRSLLGGLGALVASRFVPPAWYLDAIGPRRPDRIVAGAAAPLRYLGVDVKYLRPAWTADPDATFDLAAFDRAWAHLRFDPPVVVDDRHWFQFDRDEGFVYVGPEEVNRRFAARRSC
jgi:hypothetical protein